MNSAETYIEKTQPAVAGLFDLLRQYAGDQIRAIVGISNTRDPAEQRQLLEVAKARYVAREAIAGSILQIAYMGIKRFSPGGPRNQLIEEIEVTILDKKGKVRRYPKAFRVGRLVGDMPIGIAIYAGRNQYNHQDAQRLDPSNELVFNYLDWLYRDQYKNNISFDFYDSEAFNYAFSILAALQWLPSHRTPSPYGRYAADMRSMLGLDNAVGL